MLAALVAVFAFCAFQVNAEETDGGKCGENLTWSYNPQTATLTIEGTGEMGYYEYYKLPWLNYAEEIKHIVLPDGLLNISEQAFCNFPLLEDVNFPSTIRKIGSRAFLNCVSLKNVDFENGLESIDNDAFNGCLSLEQVILPDTVTYVYHDAFYNCPSIKEICIPAELHSNIATSFEKSDSLEKLYIRGGHSIERYVYGVFDQFETLGIDNIYLFEKAVKDYPCLLTDGVNTVSFNGGKYYEYSLSNWKNTVSHILRTEYDHSCHWYVCDKCDFVSQKEEHQYISSEVLEEPTTETFGTMRCICEVCGKTKNKAIDKLPSENSTEDDIGQLSFNTYITVFTAVFCGVMLVYALNSILLVVIIRAVIKKKKNNEKTSE